MKSWIYFPNYAWTNIIIVVATKGWASLCTFILHRRESPFRRSRAISPLPSLTRGQKSDLHRIKGCLMKVRGSRLLVIVGQLNLSRIVENIRMWKRMNKNMRQQLRDSVMMIVSRPVTLGAFLIAAPLFLLYQNVDEVRWQMIYFYRPQVLALEWSEVVQASHVLKDLWFWS